MEKLKLHTPDFTQENIARLAELFPGCVTEARAEDGTVKRAIDFDQLRQELSDHVVDGQRERYRLDWPGKRESLLVANAPVARTLRPCREESVNFDTTRNLFIEGDNLDALKLLQESYLNQIKLIYIDPPYNTGKEFIYDDDFAEGTREYLLRSNQADETGNRMFANTEANGRFHSDWLSMLYPRLRLSRNLLTDDGVIFISIDDHEVHNLRKLCDEVFGEQCLVAHIIWQHSVQPKGYSQLFSIHHNHILCYRRSDVFAVHALERSDKDNAHYSNPDNDPRGPWRTGDVRNALYRPNLIYPLTTPSGKLISPPENGWRWSKETMQEKIRTGEIVFSKDESRIIRKIFLRDQTGRAPETIWFSDDVGSTRQGANELKELFDGKSPFDTVKPTALIQRMIEIAGLTNDDICLDFFAGSCSTFHARVSSPQHGCTIMVQIPEDVDVNTPHGKVASDLQLRTIAEVGKERMRRVGRMVCKGEAFNAKAIDVGFRVLKIDSSNMKEVYYKPDALKKDDLFEHVENIKSDRTPEDLLFQVIVEWGTDLLTSPIARETIDGKSVFFVDRNALAACFDTGVTEELVKKIAARKPLRAVFRDAGFTSDAVKINVEQIFKLLSPGTDVKAI